MTGTIFARTVSPDIWRDYLLSMFDGLSLRKTEKLCGIAMSISFLMRQRVLDAVRKAWEGFKLETSEILFFSGLSGGGWGCPFIEKTNPS